MVRLYPLKKHKENQQVLDFLDKSEKYCELYHRVNLGPPRIFGNPTTYHTGCWIVERGLLSFKEACLHLGARAVIVKNNHISIVVLPGREEKFIHGDRLDRMIKFCKIDEKVEVRRAFVTRGPITLRYKDSLMIFRVIGKNGGWFLWKGRVIGTVKTSVFRIGAGLQRHALQCVESGLGTQKEELIYNALKKLPCFFGERKKLLNS